MGGLTLQPPLCIRIAQRIIGGLKVTAQLIDDVNGNWWIVYHAYAKGYHTLGRSTLIEPIEWTEDGWYRTVSAATPVTPEQEIKHGLELSDDFKGPQLELQWTFWKEYASKSLTFKEDILWMKAKGRTPADGRVLLTTAEDKKLRNTSGNPDREWKCGRAYPVL
mgnify:CR=1 FL=1